MLETENMFLVNASEKCKGLWTREENGSKSVLEYVIMEKEEEEIVDAELWKTLEKFILECKAKGWKTFFEKIP